MGNLSKTTAQVEMILSNSIKPFIFIASNTATAVEKEMADYICDGEADDVQIQAAIDSIPVSGHIKLSSGNFFIASMITINNKPIWLQGSGNNITNLSQSNDLEAMILITGTSYFYFASVTDMLITGKAGTTTGVGIKTTSIYTYDVNIRNVFIQSFAEEGFYATGTSWGLILENVVIEWCRGRQCRVTSNAKISNCKFGANSATTDKSWLQVASANIITNCQFTANYGTGAGEENILLTGPDNIFMGNSIFGARDTAAGRRIINITTENNVIAGNNFYDCLTSWGIFEGTGANNNIITNNNYRVCTFGVAFIARKIAGGGTIISNNRYFVDSGEPRYAAGSLTTGVGNAANAFAFAWQNPEKQQIIITEIIISITTAGGTATSVLNVGSGATATSASSDLLSGVDLNATGISVSTVRNIVLDANGGTTDYITGQILTEKADNLIAKYYIKYIAV